MNRHTFRASLQKCLLLCILLAGDIYPSSGNSQQNEKNDSIAATFPDPLVSKAYRQWFEIKEELNKTYKTVERLIQARAQGPKINNLEEKLNSIKANNTMQLAEQDQTVLALNASLQQHQNIYKQAQIITEIIETLITTSQIARKTADDIYNLMKFLFNEDKDKSLAILEEIRKHHNQLNLILNTAKKNLITAQAEQLIQEAYFSPEMQSIVLSCVHRPFRVNVVTGKVQDLPTTDDIINYHQQNKNLKINALHVVQEALELAQLTAKLDALIKNPKLQIYNPRLNSSFMPSLDNDLQQAFTKIQNKLTKVLHTTINKQSWSDYAWEWIPTTLQDAVFAKNVSVLTSDASQSIALGDLDYDNIHNKKNIVTIPDALLYQIIKNFDYKQRIDAQEIADLLFQQMFLAQQQVSNPFNLHAYYDDDLNNTIDQTNYVYNHVISFDDMIQRIEQSDKNTKKSLHQHLLDIRKAVQTAMYIANKNSNYYVGMIIPAQFTWLIDGALSQLMAYDNQLAELCKYPEYGGLRENQSWSLTAKIIAGVAVIGTAVAVGYGVQNIAQTIRSHVSPPPAAALTKNRENSKPLATSAKTENDKEPTNSLKSLLSIFNPSVPASQTNSITSPEASQENDAINPDIDENEIDMSNILNSIDPQEALVTTGLIGAAGTGAYKINSKIKTAQAQADAAKKESEILLKKLHEAQSASTTNTPGNAANPLAQPSVNKGIPSQAAKSSLQKIARTGAKGAVAGGLVGAAGYYIADNFIPQGTYGNDDQNQ